MIVSFRDDWLRDFFVEDMHSKKIPADLDSRLFRKLQMIDDAVTDQDLRVPPAIISRNCAAILKGFAPYVSTSNGGLSSDGMGATAKQQISIWTTIAIGEAIGC